MSQTRQITEVYRLMRVLKASPQTTVFQASDPQTGQEVVIKLLSPTSAIAPEASRARFERAMEALRAAGPVGIPRLLDHGFQPDSSAFMVMEPTPGHGLDTLAGTRPARLLPLLVQAVTTLECLAEFGFPHHNLSPDNILVTASETACVVGFGTAAFLAEADGSGLLGHSPEYDRYAAPELLDPSALRPAYGTLSDLYSLALITCELLDAPITDLGTDRPHLTLPQRMRSQLAQPDQLERVLAAALRLDIATRDGSLASLREALQASLPEVAVEDGTVQMALPIPPGPGLDGTVAIPLQSPPSLQAQVGASRSAPPVVTAPADEAEESATYDTISMPPVTTPVELEALAPTPPPPEPVVDPEEQQATTMLPTVQELELEGEGQPPGTPEVAATVIAPVPDLVPGESQPVEPGGEPTALLSTPQELELEGELSTGSTAGATVIAPVPTHLPPAVEAEDEPAPAVAEDGATAGGQATPQLAEASPETPRRRFDPHRTDPALMEQAKGQPASVPPLEVTPPYGTPAPPVEPVSPVPAPPPLPPVPPVPAAAPGFSTPRPSKPPTRPATRPAPPPPPVTVAPPIPLAIPPPSTPVQAEHHPAVAPPPPEVVKRPPKPGRRPPWLLIGGSAAGLVLLVAVVAVVVSTMSGPEPVPVPTPAPTPRPTGVPTPVVEAPHVHPQLEAAEAFLSNGEVDNARKAIAAITQDEVFLFSNEETALYEQLKQDVQGLSREAALKDLDQGLEQGSITKLRRAIPALGDMTKREIAEVHGLKEKLGQARDAVRVFNLLKRAAEDGDHLQALKHGAEMARLLPTNKQSRDYREAAAKAVEASADAAFKTEDWGGALAKLEAIRADWPDRPGLSERVQRAQQQLAGERKLQETLDAALARGRSGDPEGGLEALGGATPRGRFVKLYGDARAQLQAALEKMDQQAPVVVVVSSADQLKFKKKETARIHIRVTDDYRVATVKVMLRTEAARTYKEQTITRSGTDQYLLEVPPEVHGGGDIEFYVEATDRSGHVGKLGSAQAPFKVERKGLFG